MLCHGRLLRRVTPGRRPLRIGSLCSSDYTAGMISKIASNTICFPIDTCKTLAQTGQSVFPLTVQRLYNGYGGFLLYNFFHSWFYHWILFNSICLFQAIGYETSLKCGTVIASITSCVYKLPFTYYLRNKSAQKTVDWQKFFSSINQLQKRYAVMVMEDIPDTYLKFYLRWKLGPLFPPIVACLVTGIIIAVVMTPLDVLKTRIMTGDDNKSYCFAGWQYRLVSAVLNTTLFLVLFNQLNG